MRILFVLSLALVARIGVPKPAVADDQPGAQRSARLNTQIQVQMDYLLYLPKDYDTKESWPLVLFLHGAKKAGFVSGERLDARFFQPVLVGSREE
jgi:poly(3-hydroxybutyrate) depolymerase